MWITDKKIWSVHSFLAFVWIENEDGETMRRFYFGTFQNRLEKAGRVCNEHNLWVYRAAGD